MKFLNKKIALLSFFAIQMFLPNHLFAQCGPLSTPFLSNNGQDGIMFDIVSIQAVTLTQFAMDFDTGLHTIRIYGKTGTHVGFTNNAAAWTLLGTATNWSATTNTNVIIPITFSQFLCPGQVAAFYITSTTGGCNYSNGTAVGNTAAADANIRILQGTGKDYPFNTNFTTRTPNVRAYYSCATSCCLPPTMSFVQETCVGSCNGTATATVGAGGIAPYTYLWNTAAGNQTTQTATGLCAGTYSVSVTDNTGCVATGNVTVTSGSATQNATITPAGPFCILDPPINLTAVSPGGTWSGTGITNATTGTFNPGIAGVGSHTITYSISGPCGDTKNTLITVNAAANATITSVGPFCENDPSVTLSAVDPGGVWSGNGITNTTTGVFDPLTAGPGTHTITYTISGSCGDTKTTSIIINPAQNATITPVGPYCESNGVVTLSAVSSGGIWSGNGITNNSTGTFNPSTAGVGTHTITYTISGTCGDIKTLDIIVYSNDDATTSPVSPLCFGSSVITLSAVTPGGTWTGTGITNASNGTFDPTVAGAGTHTITYTTNGYCPDTKTTSIQVLSPLSVQISNGSTICAGSSANLNAVGSGGNGVLTYNWNDQAGNNVGTGNSLTISPSSTTSYTVTLTDGCSLPATSNSSTITVNPIPVINFAADVTNGCTPLKVVFTNHAFQSGVNCQWNFGNGLTSTNCGIDSTIYNQSGCFDVSLTVTQNGCTNSQVMANMICSWQPPDAQFNVFPVQTDILDPEFVFTNNSTNSNNYIWSFGNGAISTSSNPTYFYPGVAAGYNVCLYASNANGCVDSICKTINVIESLIYYIPNTFTPDGNEFNQSFHPIFTSGFDPYDFHFMIFNRWGEVIWESYDDKSGWDGTGQNGKIIGNGTYVWRVEFKLSKNDARVIESGHVNVIR